MKKKCKCGKLIIRSGDLELIHGVDPNCPKHGNTNYATMATCKLHQCKNCGAIFKFE